MDLSIIIPIYNVEAHLTQCIKSIINQKILAKNYEVILINDGSTDKSRLIAMDFANSYDNISFYEHENIGLSATRNKGILKSKGKYIYFIDSDDYVATNTLNKILDVANKNRLDIIEFKAIRTISRSLDKSNEVQPPKEFKVLKGSYYIESRYYNEGVWTYFYRREFLIESKVKFIEGRIMEDMIFNGELIYKANRIGYYPLDVYRYVRNPNSVWTNTEPKAMDKSIRDFIYMTVLHSDLINQLKDDGVDSSIVSVKQQTMLFNICKRVLRSDYDNSSIRKIYSTLEGHDLYPLKIYRQHSFSRKSLTYLFNRKSLFITTHSFYKRFQNRIEKFVIKKYNN